MIEKDFYKSQMDIAKINEDIISERRKMFEYSYNFESRKNDLYNSRYGYLYEPNYGYRNSYNETNVLLTYFLFDCIKNNKKNVENIYSICELHFPSHIENIFTIETGFKNDINFNWEFLLFNFVSSLYVEFLCLIIGSRRFEADLEYWEKRFLDRNSDELKTLVVKLHQLKNCSPEFLLTLDKSFAWHFNVKNFKDEGIYWGNIIDKGKRILKYDYYELTNCIHPKKKFNF